MKKQMKKEQILADIKYNSQEGSHICTMCECGRQLCRASKCNLCLRDELEVIDK